MTRAVAWVRRWAKILLPRKVRAGIYGAGYAALVGLVAADQVPAWVLAPASPLLLAILNLTPADVEEGEVGADPDQ